MHPIKSSRFELSPNRKPKKLKLNLKGTKSTSNRSMKRSNSVLSGNSNKTDSSALGNENRSPIIIGKVTKRSDEFVFLEKKNHSESKAAQKVKNLEQVNEVSEDFWQFFEHSRKAWYYFFCIIAVFITKIILFLLFVLIKILKTLWLAVVFLFKIILSLFVLIYFVIRLIFPTKEPNPLSNAHRSDLFYRWDKIISSKHVLFLGLNKTLVYCSESRPSAKSKTVLVKLPDSQVKKLYCQMRPGLIEFISEMSKNFKIVIFTQYPPEVAEEIVNLFNKSKFVYNVLYRRNMVKVDGKAYKSIRACTENVDNSMFIDHNPEVVLEKEVLVTLPPFTGDKDDKWLSKYASFLNETLKEEEINMKEVVQKMQDKFNTKRMVEEQLMNDDSNRLN